MIKISELFAAFIIVGLMILVLHYKGVVADQAETINQSTIWFDETEAQMKELQARADAMQTTCTQYLNEVTYGRPN